MSREPSSFCFQREQLTASYGRHYIRQKRMRQAEFGGDYTSPRRRAMSAACASRTGTSRSRSESGSSGWACGMYHLAQRARGDQWGDGSRSVWYHLQRRRAPAAAMSLRQPNHLGPQLWPRFCFQNVVRLSDRVSETRNTHYAIWITKSHAHRAL
jgi:hypothetical protein